MQAVVRQGLAGASVHWLGEEPPLTFLADPFGVSLRTGGTALFAERFDYRDRHGWIERLDLAADGRLLERRLALREPWHLSYPVPLEAEGAQWLLPEAHRSGALTLYRAHQDWDEWQPECRIMLDAVPVDASPVWHEGRWWLFYAPAGSKAEKIGRLHIAHAERLTGPWTAHPGNPVRRGADGSRPGGLPQRIDGRLLLPVQDCRRTYGAAIRPLWIDRLDPREFAATLGEPIGSPAGAGAYRNGLHTLNPLGERTLIDCKRIDQSLAGLAIELRRRLGR
ncbi:formyl transferase [Sphingomonas ginkgonis]|uniref:Formyl transferase n=1 Tax=Sphingomonas ginkgonis TaxID=2315330 RepID=A0A3R9YPN6_9SPHN|nr:formyl transferase [Sphingomonas ginkgonis]